MCGRCEKVFNIIRGNANKNYNEIKKNKLECLKLQDWAAKC